MRIIETDQNWNDESTTVWCDCDGEVFGVVFCNSDRTIVDVDGVPAIEFPVSLNEVWL